MAELVANFTLSEGVEFDTVFQINATPTKVSQLDNDLSYQTDTQVAESIDEAATTINNRIDDINNTLQGYGNIVTHNVSEFATSAQGALADTALQPNDNITELYNNAGYITDSALEGYATESFVTSQGYITGIDSEDVTTALGYTPYNSSNPNGYQANVIETIKVNGTAQTITAKTVDITVPTNNNQLTNGAGYITTSSVGKANLTIQRNGTALGTFNANATEPLTVNISVPTTASDLNAVPTSRKINGHTLTADVTLTAADVGALPDSTTIGSANLTIKRNNTAIGSFSANATEAIAIDITVPTTATEVGALPSTTTITDLVSTTQMNAINSGATTTNIGQIATNTSAIATINGKIPSQASSSNQLADKSFVNSSIATNTANFIGTFNSVAELEAYSGTLTNNDYAFVVTTDSAGNTLYDRYKYNGSEWLFEYELNNSSFTAAQWSAINSGITSSDVTLIGTALQPNDNISELTNDAGYITSSALTGYATETWVGQQGYLTSSDLNGYATESFVTSQGYITGITSSDVTSALGYTPYNSSNPSGYQANVIETVKVNGTALTVTSKAVDVTVPTKVSDLTNDSGYTTNVGTVTKVNNTSPDSNGNVTISIPSAVTETTVSGWGFTKNTGTVTSVNNVSPVNGNVTLSIPASQVNSDWNATSGKAQILNKPTLATVATSGSYNDLSNQPTIPTVNNATLTIQKNGTTVKTFTANASSDVTANITVPTKTSDLTNDDGFITGITSSDVTTALGYTPYNSSNPNGYITNSAITNMQTTTNLVTSVSSASTDSQYPSAKLFYDTCGDIETLINAL